MSDPYDVLTVHGNTQAYKDKLNSLAQEGWRHVEFTATSSGLHVGLIFNERLANKQDGKTKEKK